MGDTIIEVKHVKKRFRDNIVLNDVSITCMTGKIYGIVGYNGSGKTVLFKCICGFLHPDEGTIYVNGRQMGKEIRMLTEAGIIIEDPGFLANKSGKKNLSLLYEIRNKRNPEHITEIMEKVGLEPNSRKHVKYYSLGMKQRLAIAQATMEDQKILILDEPMNGLDKRGVEEMRNYFMQLRDKGKVVLLASHNREDINILCDEVYEMDHGVLTKYSQ